MRIVLYLLFVAAAAVAAPIVDMNMNDDDAFKFVKCGYEVYMLRMQRSS